MSRRDALGLAVRAEAFIARLRADPAGLPSPWDRPVPLAPSLDPPAPPSPALMADLALTGYYTDALHSIIDPAREAAYLAGVMPYRKAALDLAAMADHFRATGSPAAAQGVVLWLARFAADRVLAGDIRTQQAGYVRCWMLCAYGTAWLKVRGAAVDITPATRGRIVGWLAVLAERVRQSNVTSKTRNNHRYAAGVAVMVAGIAAGRRDLFRWGVKACEIGIDQITPQGTLPLEMARGSRALHYHLFAAAPLVTMAELAAASGLDLYARNGDALRRLVTTAAAGLADPAPFAETTGVAQLVSDKDIEEVAWMRPLARRFPDAPIEARLTHPTVRNLLYLGGEPP